MFFHKNIGIAPQPNKQLESIAIKTNQEIRTAAVLHRFVSFLPFWDGEGLSDRNYNVFIQMYLLTKALGLPMIAAGGFNNCAAALQDAVLLELLNAVLMEPSNVKSILNTSTSRIVDFLICSQILGHIVRSENFIVFPGVFSPHLCLDIALACRSGAILATQLVVVPRALPKDLFKQSWNNLNQY